MILWFFSDEHIELRVLESPHVDLLVDLLVQGLQLEAEIGGTFSFNEAVAVVVDLGLDLQSQECSCFLRCLCECCEIVISNFILVPPE